MSSQRIHQGIHQRIHQRIHEECLVFDGHTDLPSRLLRSPADVGERLGDGHIDLPRLREGGVNALVLALFVPGVFDPQSGWEHALELYELTRGQLREGGLELAESAEQIRRASARGGVAGVLGLENGRPLLVPGALTQCGHMGVRLVTLTHFQSHEWCDASTDEARHGGLATEGIGLVRDMNRLGIVPDISHISDAAAWQVMDVSRSPVVASHSSARALCDHPRNLSDELVEQVARTDGVVMANAYPAFLDPAAARANQERMQKVLALLEPQPEESGGPGAPRDRGAWLTFVEERQRELAAHPLPPVALDTYVDHILHFVERVGEEFVGIGTDFDGIDATPEGLRDASELPNLTRALLDRGLDRAGVRLILGENFLRVLETAERRSG
jgi:membrane dipeptidase